MIDLADKLRIGRVLKKHGVHGQVILESDLLADNEETQLELVFILIEGKPVPFFLEEIRPKTANTFILKLEFVDSKEGAEEITTCEVYASVKNISVRPDSPLQWLGYEVYTPDQMRLGIIKNLQTPDVNPLFVIEKADGNTMLVPAHSDMIISTSKRKKKVVVDLPEGFELE